MTTPFGAPTVNYELCEACETAMQEAGIYGLTGKEMFEQKSEFYFDLAFALLGDGHYLTRKSEEDQESPRVFAITEMEDSSEENPHYELGLVNMDTDKIIGYVTLSNEDLFADDWMIAKYRENEEEE